MALASNALTTVANLKSYAGISVTTYDTLLELLVNSISEWIENECGRSLLDSGEDVVEIYDGDDGTGICKIFTRKYPITSITSIEYRSGDLATPTWIEYTLNEYTFDPISGVIYFTGALFKGYQNIRVTYQGGLTSIPADLELACLKMVSKEFNKRKSQGATSESVGGGSVGWNEQVDPSAIKIFQKYRRFS